MSYHIVSIDSHECKISVCNYQLTVYDKDGKRQVPLEDVACIIISSFKCSISSNFLIEASKLSIGVIICDCYKPACVVLPVDRCTDTYLLRNIAKLTKLHKDKLWKKTVDAKCNNQLKLAETWNKNHPLIHQMRNVAYSIKSHKEAECAKLFWRVFSDSFFDGDFKRNRGANDSNVLLNYAYAILLSCVLRNLLALGVDPTFGIFHVSREHSAPLAYDLMEPFRCVFEARVALWIRNHQKERQEIPEYSVTKEYRSFILSTLQEQIMYNGREMSVKSAVEQVIRSFRTAVITLQTSLYEPWKM